MTATLAGHKITSGRLNLPAWGVTWAEVSLDEEVTLTGRVSLVVADLTVSATVMSGGPGPLGRSSYRLAAGAGGWGATIAAKNYANDAGVKAATVLADAASACGEALDAATLPTTRLGPGWTREEGPAARTLEQIVPAGWYVGEDGITRIGKRAARTLSGATSVVAIDLARRTAVLATETIAALTPGITVQGIEAVDVMHEIAPTGKLRSTIWGTGPATTERQLTAFRRLLEQLDPDRNFRSVYEYRVVTQEAERLNLQPVRVSIGMPDLARVPVRPGVPGGKATHALGSRVLVAFVDASPARPVVLGFEEADGDGFVPTVLELDGTAIKIGAGALLAAARVTDPVVAGPFAGTITGPGSLKTRIA